MVVHLLASDSPHQPKAPTLISNPVKGFTPLPIVILSITLHLLLESKTLRGSSQCLLLMAWCAQSLGWGTVGSILHHPLVLTCRAAQPES